MITIALTKRFQYLFKIGQALSDLKKKTFLNAGYSKSSEYYTAVLNQYLNFGSYLNIFSKASNLNSIQTNIDIQSDILGADIKSIIGKNGKPDFVFSENKLTIYLYKWKFNGLKIRCEIHFYNNKAFLVNYNYNILSNTEKDYVIKTIAQKYLNQDTGNLNIQNSKIIDKNNNMLFINDLLDYKVTYFSNKESGWLLGLTNEINEKKKKEIVKTRLAEKRFYNMI